MNKKLIAIVDDDKTSRYILRRHIEKIGNEYEFIEFLNGRAFIDFFQKSFNNKVDKTALRLVFLDINMPIMSGLEVLNELSVMLNNYSFKFPPVVICSSSSLNEEKSKALDYDFVTKTLVKGSYTRKDIQLLIEN